MKLGHLEGRHRQDLPGRRQHFCAGHL